MAARSIEAAIARIAERHQVSEDAVKVAYEALRRGGRTIAQFSHEAFGGMAQWSRGGMSMVGDTFNNAMKAKLDAVMADLAELAQASPVPVKPAEPIDGGAQANVPNWRPSEFGNLRLLALKMTRATPSFRMLDASSSRRTAIEGSMIPARTGSAACPGSRVVLAR